MLIKYTVGNGYSCNCCRCTEQHVEAYDSCPDGDEAEKQAHLDRVVDDFACVVREDYEIDEIYDFDLPCTEEEFKELVEKACQQNEKRRQIVKRIETVQKNIKSHQQWLDDVPKNILFYKELLEKDKKELANLIGTLP